MNDDDFSSPLFAATPLGCCMILSVMVACGLVSYDLNYVEECGVTPARAYSVVVRWTLSSV